MIKTLKYSFTFLLICLGLFARAGNLSISIDKDSMMIGDHLLLSLLITFEDGERALLPPLVDSVLIFDIVETYKPDSSANTISQDFLLTQFDAGTYAVGNIPAMIIKADGSLDTLISNSIELEVTTIEVDTTQAIKPIKPVQSLPFPWKSFIKKSLLILLPILLIIGLIIFYFLRKKKFKVFQEKPKTMLDYYEDALTSLQNLENEKLWQNERVKEYYLGLSEILREYVEGRFGVQAMESTTDEINEALFLNDALKSKLVEILKQADLAKFAKFKPLGDENIKMMKLAKDFVNHTKPKTITELDDK